MSKVGIDQLNCYRLAPDEVITKLRSHKMGLTNSEAERRLLQYGPNVLQTESYESNVLGFLSQLKKPLILLMLISTVLAWYIQNSKVALTLLVIVVMNVIVGYLIDHSSYKTTKDTNRLLPARTKVLRSNVVKTIDVTNITIGDIVVIKAGDIIPADLRILNEHELRIDDGTLAGHNDVNRKHGGVLAVPSPIAKQDTTALAGATVVSGHGQGIVVAIGVQTALGKIVALNWRSLYDNSLLRNQLSQLATRLIKVDLVLLVIVAILSWQTHVTLRTFISFAITTSACLISSGLLIELAVARKRAAKAAPLIKVLPIAKRLASTNSKILQTVVTDNVATLSTVLVSIIGQIFFQVPLAVTVMQILAINAVVLILPTANIDSGTAQQRRYFFSNSIARELILFGTLAGIIAYTNFLFFFVRHRLSPAHIDISNPLYLEAMSLTFLTLILCQLFNVLLVGADNGNRLLINYMRRNKQLLVAVGASLLFILTIIYVVPAQRLFDIGSLSPIDWVTALGGATIYLAVRLLQRHSRHHTRRAIIQLHREVHGKASPARI